ncbi:MAG: hypothetical protein AAGC74_04670 [Verrucomicrobiota bacterium]
MSEDESEKSPWVWKAVIVFLPAGLALSVGIALFLKVGKEEVNELTQLEYAAADYDSASLRDAVRKLEDLIGARDFDSEDGQFRMRGVAALIEGSLGPNNLGYEVRAENGYERGGRLWKSFWVDRETETGSGMVVLAVEYGEESDSGAVAALFSIAEWLRGRDLGARVRVAFLPVGERLRVVANERVPGGEREVWRVSGLGQGSAGLEWVKGSEFEGELRPRVAEVGGLAEWTLTTSWEDFEEQVRGICERLEEWDGPASLEF